MSLSTNISIAQVLLSGGCQDYAVFKAASATDRSSHNLVFCSAGINMFPYRYCELGCEAEPDEK